MANTYPTRIISVGSFSVLSDEKSNCTMIGSEVTDLSITLNEAPTTRPSASNK